MKWEEAVSEMRELAKDTEDFTSRLHALASKIQRMERDADRNIVHLYSGGIESVACGDESAGYMTTQLGRVTCPNCCKKAEILDA